MKKINLSFRRYTDGLLLILAQAILAALTGNSFFPVISPSLATLQTTITDYSTALAAAAQGGKTNVAIKNARKKDLINVLVSLALDIMKLSDGDLVMLTSSGFPLSKDKTPVGPMDTPQILKLEDGPVSGSLKATIGSVKGAKIYGYEYTQDPLTDASEWDSEVDSQVKHVIFDLETGKKYWVRVVAYGKGEQESYSDPVSRIVQ
jgi:hypothetical protein